MTKALSAIRVAALVVFVAGACCGLANAGASDDSGKIVLLSPKAGKTLLGQSAEVAVGYSFSSVQVTYAELYVDGKLYAIRNFEQPRSRGVCSFLCDCTRLPNASHIFLVRVFAGERLLGAVSGAAEVANRPPDSSAPKVKFEGIRIGQSLSGRQEIRLVVSDESDGAPMVSVHVDKDLKLLSNRPPYSFTLDTTDLGDGVHTIEAYATDEAGNTGKAEAVQVVVANHPQGTLFAKSPENRDDMAVTEKSPAYEPAGKEVMQAAIPTVVAPPAIPRTEAARSRAPDLPESPFLSGATYSPPVKVSRPIRETVHGKAEVSSSAPVLIGRPESSLPTPAPISDASARKFAALPVTEDVAPARQVAPETAEGLDVPYSKLPQPAMVAMAPVDLSKEIVWPAQTVTTARDARQAERRKCAEPTAMQLLLNGRVLGGDVRPRINKDGVGITPIRQIVEGMGGRVTWNPRARTVTAWMPERCLQFTIGENVAILNRKQLRMKAAAYLESGRAMIPVAFLAEAIGLEIYYDVAESRFVLATKPERVYG